MDIEFIDVDTNNEAAAQYNVRSVPTTIVLENGQEVNRMVGAQTKKKVLEVIS